jgi:hypothetical protein
MKYRRSRLDMRAGTPRAATWTFAGTTVTGYEYPYTVTDKNFSQRNEWQFVVREPKAITGRVEVRPVSVPNDRAYAGLDRRGLTFRRATIDGYTQFRYCPVSLPRTDGKGTRVLVRRGERTGLPHFVRDLGWRLRLKQTVRRTRGTDGNTQVALVRINDHEAMIGIYMATKAWVLKAQN